MTMLQLDLIRSTFAVCEMERKCQLCVCNSPNFCSGPRVIGARFLPEAPLCWPLSHFDEGAYTIRLLYVRFSVNCELNQDSWKIQSAFFWRSEYMMIVNRLAKKFQIRARSVKSCLVPNWGHFQRMLLSCHISYTTNGNLLKFCCNIIIGDKN
jgi:hypothetical protein